MDFLRKLYVKLPILAFDAVCIPISWALAYWLRYNMTGSMLSHWKTLPVLSVLITTQLSAYYFFRVYRGLWRYSSLKDVSRILLSIGGAIIVIIVALYSLELLHQVPRTVFPLYAMFLTFFLCGARLISRILSDRWKINSQGRSATRVLIVGAGKAGESLVRDLLRSKDYITVGFVDDAASKLGHEVHGVRVLGSTNLLSHLVKRHNIELIFLAIPSTDGLTMRRLVHICEASQVPFRTLPGLPALASGQVEINSLRKVSLEDLLGRTKISLEWHKVEHQVRGKRILVTGGGGSIGSELCRQLCTLKPSKLLVLDNNEYNIYLMEQELRLHFPEMELIFSLANVTDQISINTVFRDFKPEIVFHAAAFKHVPLLEAQMRLAVNNNVFGTHCIAQASVSVHAEKFILISTDKAVNPTNVMGITKRVAEILCQNWNSQVNTQFITVRFGNVLGSAGSVVPLFNKQLAAGGPLTVTHPDVQRYFMTIPEASQLILQAMANGIGGEIFVLDMGEPIKISYLAEQMIRLAGKKPGHDISIEYIGLRPGEKLFEEMFHNSEELTQTAHEKLLQAKSRYVDWIELMQTFNLMQLAYVDEEDDELMLLLKSLVPEFQPSLSEVFSECVA